MAQKIVSIFLSLALLTVSFTSPYVRQYARADDTSSSSASTTASADWPQPCQDKGLTGQDCVNYLSSVISSLNDQAQSLSTKIQTIASQVNLTEAQIQSTQEQILGLTLNIATANNKIQSLQGSINNLTKALLNRIVATYEVGSTQPFQVLVTSGDVSDFFTRVNYLKIAQEHDKQLVYNTVQAKNDYATQQQIYENEKKQVEALEAQLQSYTDQLNQQKAQQQSLLAQVNANEDVAQSEYNSAVAQLAAFSGFVTANGGDSLLSNQTTCDSWGCYYNQRDAQWGDLVVNGSNDCNGPCTLASIGCLITSIAMVASHYGHNDILPSDIATSGGGNFAYGTAMLRYSISVKGVSISRNQIGSSSGAIPGTVTNPVIVGISYDGGPLPDHFVVLTSGSNGNYIMNDPYTANGHEIPFTSHYSLASIVEVDTISL